MAFWKRKKIEVVSTLPVTFDASPTNIQVSDELSAPASTDEKHLGTHYSRSRASAFVAAAGVSLIAISYGGIKLNEFLQNSLLPTLSMQSKSATIELGSLHIKFDIAGRLIEKANAKLMAVNGERTIVDKAIEAIGPQEVYVTDIGVSEVHITFTYLRDKKTITLWDEIIKEA